MLALTLALILVGTPAGMGRKLMDMQDLHPVEPGELLDEGAVAEADAAFAVDMAKAENHLLIENDAPVEITAVETEPLADMAEEPLEEEAVASAVARGLDPEMVTDAEIMAEMDEDDWGWEDWDQPDADTWFYNADEELEDAETGWTWDDPLDLEGDNSWDTEWAPVERDETFEGRYNATMNALSTHITPSAVSSANVGKALVRAGVSEVLNIEDHPRNNLLLEVLTILPLLPPVLLVFFLMRAASQTLTMYHLVQFACLFCAGYSGLLITAAMLTGDDPLAAFQFMAGHGAYVKYQFMVAMAYALFLLLLYVNVCVQRCGTGALVQQVTGTSVGLHYYLGTFHPAMIGLPPETVLGIPTGVSIYTMYLFVFLLMGILPQRLKDLGEDEEDDKTLGEGKGQD